jgi:hypothetical protein
MTHEPRTIADNPTPGTENSLLPKEPLLLLARKMGE